MKQKIGRWIVASVCMLIFPSHNVMPQKIISGFAEEKITFGASKLIDGVERTNPDIYYTANEDGTWRAIRLTVEPDGRSDMTVPYLYMNTSCSVCVSWKSSVEAIDAVVRYGGDSSNLSSSVEVLSKRIADTYYWNTATIDNLESDAVYYYRVDSQLGNGKIYRFRTMPTPGATKKIRVLMVGDHQRNERSDYEWLLNAAHRMVNEKYGDAPFEDNINFIMNVGDQVDGGKIDQYETVHLFKSRLISPSLSTMTAVGNHEYNGDPDLYLYKNHYCYEKLSYAGFNSGTALYYAYQVGCTLFVVINSDDPSAAQKMWVRKVIAAATVDETVDFIVSVQHRPLYAEQYSSDVSSWMLNEIMPILSSTPKHVLNYSGHHHLYARGQMIDTSVYHIISGGGVGTSAKSYEQLWGQTPDVFNHDEVQKTIDHWTYQIAEFDPVELTMTVETYSIGNSRLALDNVMVDRFIRHLDDCSAPAAPVLAPMENEEITLPYTFKHVLTDETSTTIQYQIARDENFTDVLFSRVTNSEDFYGVDEKYMPLDINSGKDITCLQLDKSALANGTYYIRTRSRNDNLQWSDYSAPVMFTVMGTADTPLLSVSGKFFRTGSEISISYAGAPVGTKAWVGIYVYGKNPGTKDHSYKYVYTNGVSGIWNLSIDTPGVYFVVLFKDEGYTEISERAIFVVSNNCDDGVLPVIRTDKKVYKTGEAVVVSYSNATCIDRDWIGIYERLDVPADSKCPTYAYVGAEPHSSLTLNVPGTKNFISPLGPGIYFAGYFNADGYNEAAERVSFVIGKPVMLEMEGNIKTADDDIVAFYEGVPCFGDECVAVYGANGLHSIHPLKNVGGVVNIGKLPVGNYELCVVTDGMVEISERVGLHVTSPALAYKMEQTKVMVSLVGNVLEIVSPEGVKCVDIFTADGQLVASYKTEGLYIVNIPFDGCWGIFIVNVNGVFTSKVLVK